MKLISKFKVFQSIICLSILFCTSYSIAAQKWIELETPRFTIISQLNERKTTEWAVEFNQFIDTLGLFIHVDESKLLPLTIVIFKNNRGYRAYKPFQPNGRVANNVVGSFVNLGTHSIISFSDSYSKSEVREIIYHEAVHWYTRALNQQLSAWLDEGLAEVFSTMSFNDNRVKVGDPLLYHIGYLRQEGLMDTSRLFRTSRNSPLFNNNGDTSVFYGNSWLFTHYQLLGEREGSTTTIGDYINSQNTRLNYREFEEVFGVTYLDMDEELKEYLRRGSFRTFSFTVEEAEFSHSFKIPSETEVDLILTSLAIGDWRLALLA